jgi:hypothetical protein
MLLSELTSFADWIDSNEDGFPLILKIALAKKRRAWFTGLWNVSDAFEYPLQFSAA